MRMNHTYGGKIRRRYILNWLNVKHKPDTQLIDEKKIERSMTGNIDIEHIR